MTEPEWNPKPWAIDPEHGRVTGPGFLGDAFHSLRVRELFRYYQPPTEEELRHFAPINTGNDFVRQTGLISSTDPLLAALANLTTRVMDMRRCVVSMTGAGTSYIIAESTRTLSLAYPHTYEPGDALMFGGGVATSSLGGLCEHTCSLLPPPLDSDEPFLLEIPDLSKHPKFCNVGYVRDWPHARFYCGAPLRTKNGVTIGTVCVLDERPRYNGLTEPERVGMSNMADLFMQYFEAKEGDRFRKKAHVMESQLSRFIAEGFLPAPGDEMVERRNGKLWSENLLESRRREEEGRRKKVGEKRQMVQDMEYAKMIMEERSGPTSYAACLDCGPASERDEPASACSSISQEGSGKLIATMIDTSGMEATAEASNHSPAPSVASSMRERRLDKGILRAEPTTEEYVPIVHPLQPGVIEMVPADLAEPKRAALSEFIGTRLPQVTIGSQAQQTTLGELSKKLQDQSSGSADDQLHQKTSDKISTRTPTSREGGPSSGTVSLAEVGPATNASSSVSGTLGSTYFPSTTAATSMDSRPSKSKRSKYEETTSMETPVRAMFARASTVIKNTIDCDVVFVDGDLEGFFEPDFPDDDPGASDEWGWSQVSSDNQSQSTVRAKRPKQQRQRSGVLGYATSKGSSSARFEGPKKITDLGFDMSELNEELLAFLLKGSDGRIFSFFDEYPGLEEHEDPEELKCKTILQKFLPGCRSVIVAPLRDHNNELLSVCFAWTCSDQKTFYGDEEGRFVTAVATSVLDEMARVRILSADKAKSEFISSISHELRSPLHGILASAEFLIDGELRPDQRSFVETIISCGTTLLDTVDHVLDFQKLNFFKDEKIKTIEAPPSPVGDVHMMKEQPPSPHGSGSHRSDDSDESLFDTRVVATDLSTIVQEVTEGVVLGHEFKDLSKILGQPDDVKKAALYAPTKISKIQIVVDIEELEGGWVFLSNPAAFKRIVGNIVGNAIKYSHACGWIKITLAAKRIEPSIDGAPRCRIIFMVSDSGKGMSREFLKTKLFTPFTQENPMASGAGLGLSIVRQLVDMIGGRIDVKSQLGKGTTFRIELKLTQAPPKDVQIDSWPVLDEVYSKTVGKKVLLIGLEKTQAPETPEQRGQILLYDSLTRYLKHLFGMDAVLDPIAADADAPDIIIVNELSAATKLHDFPGLKDRPVILMCNSTPRQSALQELDLDRDMGQFTFMRKPCGPKKLVRAFKYCLDILDNGLRQRTPVNRQKHHTQQPPKTLLPRVASDVAIAPHLNWTVADSAGFTSLAVVPLASEVSEQSHTQAINASAQEAHWRRLEDSKLPTGPSEDSLVREEIQNRDFSPPRRNSEDVPGQSGVNSPDHPVPAAQSPSGGECTPSQPKILCVEDNKINMMLLTAYLKKKKYPFKTAEDGAQAVERVYEEAVEGGFQCILMDLQMPVMSGIESTREIRRLETEFPEQYRRSYIIALTGLATSSDRQEAFDAGVDAFMVKPVSFKDLERILDEHVRKGVLLSKLRTPSLDTKGMNIVSLESSRGKHIEIKQLVCAEPLLSPMEVSTSVAAKSSELPTTTGSGGASAD